jgi:hypothetical protein
LQATLDAATSGADADEYNLAAQLQQALVHGLDRPREEELVRVRVRLGRGGRCDLDVLVSDVQDLLEDEEEATEACLSPPSSETPPPPPPPPTPPPPAAAPPAAAPPAAAPPAAAPPAAAPPAAAPPAAAPPAAAPPDAPPAATPPAAAPPAAVPPPPLPPAAMQCGFEASYKVSGKHTAGWLSFNQAYLGWAETLTSPTTVCISLADVTAVKLRPYRANPFSSWGQLCTVEQRDAPQLQFSCAAPSAEVELKFSQLQADINFFI